MTPEEAKEAKREKTQIQSSEKTNAKEGGVWGFLKRLFSFREAGILFVLIVICVFFKHCHTEFPDREEHHECRQAVLGHGDHCCGYDVCHRYCGD